MTYQNKAEFIGGLKNALSRYGIREQREILLDFEQHFSDGAAAGETEAQVCEKLGDPEEIAKQYIPEAEISVEDSSAPNQEQPAASGFGAEPDRSVPPPVRPAQVPPPVPPAPPSPLPPPVPPAPNARFSPSIGGIIGILCVDLFVLSWALPALASLIAALFCVALSFVVSGLTTFIGGTSMGFADVSGWFVSSFSPVSTVLLGVVMASGGGLVSLIASRAATGFLNVILRLVNWHARAIVGKNVCTLIGKKYQKGGTAA